MIPLVPFLLGLAEAFTVSAWMTGAVFFAIGALKSRWSLAPWWRSGLETLAIGGTAAAIAYGVGTLFQG
jgi:VIT1/CCC1 family predicted Fe2+/Mn2+ transporter